MNFQTESDSGPVTAFHLVYASQKLILKSLKANLFSEEVWAFKLNPLSNK